MSRQPRHAGSPQTHDTDTPQARPNAARKIRKQIRRRRQRRRPPPPPQPPLAWPPQAYNLVGAAHGGLSMGEVAGKHGEEVGAMCRELASFVRYTLSVSLFSGLDDRLADYARTMEFLPTRLDAGAFPFTSGYFYRYTKMAGTRTNPAGIKVEIPDTTPLHTEYLLEARDRGLVGKELLDAA